MKTFLLCFFVALSLSAAIPQPVAVRAVDTVADMTEVQPEVVSLARRSGLLVRGYESPGDWGPPRIFYYGQNYTNAVDNGCYFSSIDGTSRWYDPECIDGPVDVRWFNIRPDKDDNAAEWTNLGDHVYNLRWPKGWFRFSNKLTTPSAYTLKWEGEGVYQGGWESTNFVSATTLVYTGSATNDFIDLTPALQGTNQPLRYGLTLKNIAVKAGGLATNALKIQYAGRARLDTVAYNEATGTNLYLGQVQFLQMENCTTSGNDSRPALAVRAGVGAAISLGSMASSHFSAASTIANCIFENSTNWALILGPNDKNLTVLNGAIESNDGNGMLVEPNTTSLTVIGTWFEANHGTNLWIRAPSFWNTFIGLRMFEDSAAVTQIEGGYNKFLGCQFTTVNIPVDATRNKFENCVYSVAFNDATAGGTQHFDTINAAATVRTNTFSSPFVHYGEPFVLWNSTNVYPKVSLSYNGIYFGDGSNPPRAGITRWSDTSIATTNTFLFFPQGPTDTFIAAYEPGDAQPRLKLTADGYFAAGPGGTNLVDVYWKRNGASNWLTQAETWILRPNTNDNALAVIRAGSAYLDWLIHPNGWMEWGFGATPRDAFIDHPATGTLRIRTNLVVGGLSFGYGTYTNFPVTSVFGRTGDVTAQSGDYDASQISFLDEWIDDRVGSLVVGRTNIAVTYNDAGNVLYIDYTGPTSTGLTDAPSDGKLYGRKDAAWAQTATNHIAGLSDWMSTKSNTNHVHTTTDITSGTFVAERLGTGTPSTNTFLQGNGAGNSPFWGTIPSTPSPTNGIADAPADSVFYGRKNNSWTQPSRTDISGISSWAQSWLDSSVVSNATTAATYLTLIGGSPITIDSPAKFTVRRASSGAGYTRHRLNVTTVAGIDTTLTDDAGNDEQVLRLSISDFDFGDIETSSSGTKWNIKTGAVTTVHLANNAVTTNKLQLISSTNVVLAVTTATGVPRAVSLGDGLITTPNAVQLNVAGGTNIVLTTNAQGRITINSSSSGSGTSLPTLIGWVRFSVTPLFALNIQEFGGDVNSINLVEASDSRAINLGVSFSTTYATTYHVTCEIEGQNNPSDATYLPKWWIKQDSKTTGGFNFMASLWDYYGYGSAPVGDIFTLWIWRRE